MLLRIFLAPLLILLLTSAASAADDFCFQCHQTHEGTGNTFKKDIHRAHELSCSDCHGGDASINNMNKSKAADKGFRPRPSRDQIPLFCAGCHSNAKFMATYDPNLPTNQYALYARSVHSQKPAAGKAPAAECIDCHGIHDIQAPSDPESKTNPKNINATCGSCHKEILDSLSTSPHDPDTNITCITCHGSHSTQKASAALLDPKTGSCARCHMPTSSGAQAAAQIAKILDDLDNAGESSKAALAKAKVVAHSFNPATIQSAITAATRPAASPP